MLTSVQSSNGYFSCVFVYNDYLFKLSLESSSISVCNNTMMMFSRHNVPPMSFPFRIYVLTNTATTSNNHGT